MFPSDSFPLEVFLEHNLDKESIIQKHKKGTEITELLRQEDHIYFITKGIVLVYRLQESGNISIIDFKSAGQILKPTIDIAEEDRGKIQYKAYQDSVIFAFNRSQLFFNKNYASKKDMLVSKFLTRIIENDIISIYRQLELFKETSLEKRYAMFIEMYSKIYNHISDRLISSFLGVHFTTLSRMKARYLSMSKKTG